MIYTGALLATILASSTAFQGMKPASMRTNSVRMAEEEPWFPGSVTSNTVDINDLG